MCLSESTAIAAYLLAAHGKGAMTRLDRAPGDPDYAAYLQWFHFANGSLQASMLGLMSLTIATINEGRDPSESASVQRGRLRLEAQLRMVDEHLGEQQGDSQYHKWFAGSEFSAADCMMAFSLTTMRGFLPLDLAPYPGILRWLRDVAARPAYRRALEKADGGMEPMTEPSARRFTEFKGLKGVLEKL